MADDRHIGNVGNAITRLPMDRFGETWVVAFDRVPDMSGMMRLPWERPFATNRAFNI